MASDRRVKLDKDITNVAQSDLLNEVDKAIFTICAGGQSYRIGSRELTRADLKVLYQIKNDLMAQVAAGQQGNLLDDCFVAVFNGR